MSRLIAIVGDTGTGKSTSIKTLYSKTTYVINTARKDLPFRGSAKLYNRESKNFKEEDDAIEILKILKSISEKAPEIKDVIIEDSNYARE